MNPNEQPLYAGFYGIDIEEDQYLLGEDLKLEKTYAHVFAPYMISFKKPSKKDKFHPGPWKNIGGGISFDITSQLFIPESFLKEGWFDRLNTIWWIAVLLRLKVNPRLVVPVVSNEEFKKVPMSKKDLQFWPIEISPKIAMSNLTNKDIISRSDIDWIKRYWIKSGNLAINNTNFYSLINAFDSCLISNSTGLAILSLWGAIEQIFSPAKYELRYRISSNIASFLEPVGTNRLKLQKEIKRLYDKRSVITHTSETGDNDSFVEIYNLTQKIIFKIIENNHVPSHENLETLVFCGR